MRSAGLELSTNRDEKRRDTRDAARRAAFQTLYEASVRKEAPKIPEDADAARLVAAVDERYDQLLSMVEPHLKKGWSFDRLTLAERLILLLGAAEVVATERGTPGIVGAWTHLADLFGEEKSHRFINAVLLKVATSRT